MGQGMLHRLIAVLMDAASKLEARCECRDFEKMAVLVHRVMSYQSRQFHTLEHVFGFLDGADGETALAAVFHDLIYFQVDDGLPPDLDALLRPYIRRDGGSLRIADDVDPKDEAFGLCLSVFGFSQGDILNPFRGQNEFLSALAMALLLGPHLPREVLVAIAACVEASIPFRKANGGGEGPAEVLATRLGALADSHRLSLDADGIKAVIRRSVAFGNADVRDFALADPGLFLDNTWKLLPESNASLRHRGAFSIREYRLALGKMQGFFTGLDAASIYHSYDGIPDAAAMEALASASRRNIALASTYLKAKLLAVGVLEAAAEISGGDAPMALFMGDIAADGGSMETLASHLADPGAPAWIDPGNPLYRLLRDGRLDGSSFDLRNSPLALYFYDTLEPRAWAARVESAYGFFSGSIEASAFLEGFRSDIRKVILGACVLMVPTRKAFFEDWLKAHP